MPREYPPWDMTPEDRDNLSRRMDEGMYAGIPEGTAVEDLIAQVGRDKLLEVMSGTTDKSSRAWKNARDNLSRYRRGARRPSAENQRRMRGAGEQQRRTEIGQARRAHVRLNATVTTSKNRWGYADADLTGRDLTDFLEARGAGNDELAAQIVFDAYGLDPDVILGMDEITGFDINWGEP